jgi:hypothetical protein
MKIEITKVEENLIKYRDLESGVEFAIAKDSMGTQICNSGNFFPDSRNFRTIEKAQEFLNTGTNLLDAFQFFSSPPEVSTIESLFTVMFGIMEEEYLMDMEE